MQPFTALAHPNIAFIKYWGNRNDALRLPANGSISMNLDGLETRTTVHFDTSLRSDDVKIDGKMADGVAHARVGRMLDDVRTLAGIRHFAWVESENNFPTGTGIASSASAFAALALAATRAAGLDPFACGDNGTSPDHPSVQPGKYNFDLAALSRLARRGSGSACRSIPGGFVEWTAGTGDVDSYAVSIAPPEHWNLTDCITVISTAHKTTGSTEGHKIAGTSPLQPARVVDAPRRLGICRQAILNRDFAVFAEIMEEDSNLMHAVMMTSRPPLFYWLPATLGVMQAVRSARAKGLPVCYTIDAGPNVHVICPSAAAEDTAKLLRGIPGVRKVQLTKVGGPARLVENPSAYSHSI
jgi:diphosphomevalonate decarboxylase